MTTVSLDCRARAATSMLEKPASTAPLRVDCHQCWKSLAPLRDEWDFFVESVGGDLFSSFDWCEVWWKHFGPGRKLEIYIVQSGGDWVAIFPLFRETLRCGPIPLRVVRLLGCDHCVTTCGVPVKQGFAGPAVDLLLKELCARESWDVLQLGELAGYSENSSDLTAAIRGQPCVGRMNFLDNCYPHMVFDVPADADAFLAQLSLKERRNVRKDQRELDAAGGGFHEPGTPGELQAAFDELVAMHDSQWQARGRGGHFGDWPGSESFHLEFALRALRSGRLALVEVRTPEKLLASEYTVRFGKRLHWIIGARGHGVSSRIGYLGLLERAWRDGLKEIDALPGNYDYKRRLGARVVGVKDILAVRDSRSSRRRFAVHRAASEALSYAYGRAWWWHVAPWLAKKMPHLWESTMRRPLWTPYIRSRFLATREASTGSSAALNESPPEGNVDTRKVGGE